ncbi:MAG: phosphoglycerate dehydrogenase [Spirochaetia bacterium]|jgi:D-3-phosphoglycerate dehydrogenase|nr:phosphoglycerate dehydrogenase [Spirochaetia bacterium]
MSKYFVIITARSFGLSDDLAYRCLENAGCEWIKIDEKDGPIGKQLERMIPRADAVIAGLEPIDRNLISKACRLKVISRYGVGYDNIDYEAAKGRHIQITITPGTNGDSVADLAFGLLLAVARNIPLMDASIKNLHALRPQGLELYGKTLGVVGTGRIGQSMAERGKGFNMKVLAYDIYPNKMLEQTLGLQYVDFDSLLRNADCISVHAPLTPETENMFSLEQFQKMKSSTIFVNTARAEIVNEMDLAKALSKKIIYGAGLDVVRERNISESPFVSCPNCILTPHAGAATREASSKMSLLAVQNAIEVLEGKVCKYSV